MTSSPAWLTVALSTLANVDDLPAQVLRHGIRTLPQSHILHHLNRWARHVWRPAITPQQLHALTDHPHPASLHHLNAGAASLLGALLDAVRRCEARPWLHVLGVMFLAADPWAIDVGYEQQEQVSKCAHAIEQLFQNSHQVSRTAAALNTDAVDLPVDGVFAASTDEAFAELRCRVAALQLQLDDVTAVVRQNEKNTKDLLSSFHFWSLLLLDELRSYKHAVRSPVCTPTQSHAADMASKLPPMRPLPAGHRRDGSGSDMHAPPSASTNGAWCAKASASIATSPRAPKGDAKPKRVFRDGKWVTL